MKHHNGFDAGSEIEVHPKGIAMPDTVKAVACGEIATVILNRPSMFNAFDLDTIAHLAEHLINLAVDTSVRAVVITGEGKAL